MTWTEVGGAARARQLRRQPGWRTFAPDTRTDVAVSWQAGLWAPRARWVAQLTVRRHWTPTGALARPQRALYAVLDRGSTRVLVTVAHLPTHVQAGDQFGTLTPRVRVWRSAIAGWAAATADAQRRWQPDLILVVADWNVDLRRTAWRSYVQDAFRHLRISWRPRAALPAAGTRNARFIDATLTNGAGRARLLSDDATSDHRPYREELRPPTQPG